MLTNVRTFRSLKYYNTPNEAKPRKTQSFLDGVHSSKQQPFPPLPHKRRTHKPRVLVLSDDNVFPEALRFPGLSHASLLPSQHLLLFSLIFPSAQFATGSFVKYNSVSIIFLLPFLQSLPIMFKRKI